MMHKISILLAVVGLGALAAAIYLWNDRPQPMPPEVAPANKKQEDAAAEARATEVRDLVAIAHELQNDRKWCEAERQWSIVLDVITRTGEPPDLQSQLRAARGNRELTRALCKPSQPLVKEAKFGPDPGKGLKPLGKERFLDYYPPGHHLRHLTTLRIKGQAANADWGVKREQHFSYWHQVAAETKVLANDGRVADVEVRFAAVRQILHHQPAAVQLDLPEGNFGGIVWDAVGQQAARKVPQLKLVKTMADIVLTLDPDLKRTLTTLHNGLEAAGVNFDNHAEIIAKVDQLQGHCIRFKYRDGIGVVSGQVMDDSLPQDVLQDVAEDVASLIRRHDLFDKKVGDKWREPARTLAGALAVSQAAVCLGDVAIERRADEVEDKTGSYRLGESLLTIKSRRPEVTQQAEVFVKSGQIFADLNLRFITDAKVHFQGNTLFRTQDHLLFRAEQVHDVQAHSTYHAEIVKLPK